MFVYRVMEVLLQMLCCALVEIIAWVFWVKYSILLKINSRSYSEDFGSAEAERGCWEQNPYPLEKQHRFLTADLSLMPRTCWSETCGPPLVSEFWDYSSMSPHQTLFPFKIWLPGHFSAHMTPWYISDTESIRMVLNGRTNNINLSMC